MIQTSARAVAAPHDGRLQRESAQADEAAAVIAKAELSGLDPPDCRFDGPDPSMSSCFLCRRHGLLLHRIHPAEPTDALLIQLDRPAVRRRLQGCGLQALQLFLKPWQECHLQLVGGGVRHGDHRIRTTGTLQDRTISVVVEPITRLRMRL